MKLSDVTGGGAPAVPAPDAETKKLKLSDVTGVAPEAPKEAETSTVGALWKGLVHGVEMTGRGTAQLAESMPTLTGIGAQGRQKLLGQTEQGIEKSETAYQASPQVKQHPIASGIGRLGGEMAATAPLAAVPGAAAGRAATLWGRLVSGAGASAAMGAAAGLTQPATGEGLGFAGQKIGQAGVGAVGGVAGGALGEVVGSTLGRAIGGNNPNAVDAALTRQFRRAVRPGRGGQANAPQLAGQDHRILTAVDDIIAERPHLNLTDASGNTVTGQLPRTLRQFSEAIDHTRNTLFRTYDQMARAAGQQGAMVDLAPAATRLRQIAASPEVVDFHPNLAADADRLADQLTTRGTYSAEEAQGVIQNLNRTLAGFYRNPTDESVTHASILSPVSRLLREGLDQAVERFQGPGYQQLRLRYGALRSIEQDVAGAVQREANKRPGGLGATFADIAASEEAIRGIFTLNPAAIGRAAAIKTAQLAVRHINSPNRAIDRMFRIREASQQPQAGRRSWLAPAGGEAADDYFRDRGYRLPEVSDSAIP